MTGEMEASLSFVTLEYYFEGILNIPKNTEDSNHTSEIGGVPVEIERVLQKPLSFQVLRPPLEKLWFSLLLDEHLKPVEVSGVTKHPGHFYFMSATQYVVVNGSLVLSDRLEVLCKSIVGAL